jgi:1-deoxy-D-xylulose-5-phosphate synthase
MQVAFDLQGRTARHSVAVIGDGAITGGQAYEAMNNCAYLGSKLVVVYNDNGQVSLPTGTPSAGGTVPAGALSASMSRVIASKPFKTFRDTAKSINKLFPEGLQEANKKIDEYARGLVTGGTLFEELGFYYVGPVDGHDLDNLIPILEDIRDRDGNDPVLLHIKTEKGKGYLPAENASDKYHGVPKFDVGTGKKFTSPNVAPSYTSIFSDTLIRIAEKDRSVVAVTAAMPGGTGVDKFGKRFPKRTFDVGIAEQHAVTFGAGMAVEGLKPFVAIYSTFLQRAYDQVVHDVAIQNLPVRLILDRAGLVGNDGPTHHGSFDLAYLGCIPKLVICAPSDEVELQHMLQTVYEINDAPTALRYPRGNALGLDKLNDLFGYDLEEMPPPRSLEVGKGRIVREGRTGKGIKKAAILSIGTRLASAVEAARAVEEQDPTVGVTVADARWMKPLDRALIDQLASEHEVLITIEEGSIGGFGDHVLHYLALSGALDDGTVRVRPMVLPDSYIEAASQNEQYERAGLDTESIEETLKTLLRGGVVDPVAEMQKSVERARAMMEERDDEEPTIA